VSSRCAIARVGLLAEWIAFAARGNAQPPDLPVMKPCLPRGRSSTLQFPARQLGKAHALVRIVKKAGRTNDFLGCPV